jgi:hypothetical protein
MYMAPEIQFGGRYSSAADLWSLGTVIFELITGKTIFPEAQTQYELAQELKTRGAVPLSLPESISVSPALRDLVSALLTIDPNKRINMAHFLRHPFFGGAGREQRFSFSVADRSVDEGKAEMFVCEARETADLIAEMLSSEPGMAKILVFELLIDVCDLLMDFLTEYRTLVQNTSISLQNSVVETIRLRAGEAAKVAKGNLERIGMGASQYLLEKGLEYARNGVEAERNGDDQAVVQYQRSLAMLRPIVYSRNSDEFTVAVRELFVQIVKRRDLAVVK